MNIIERRAKFLIEFFLSDFLYKKGVKKKVTKKYE